MARRKENAKPGAVPFRIIIHIGREYLLSFAISFLFFFIVFFINQMLLLAEDILSKNAALDQTMLLLLYSLPSVVAIAFPFSALAGALMTSASLNADNEFLALSAAGISPRALFAPFLVMGLLASGISFTANDYFLPRGSMAFRKVYGKLVATSAAIELSPYSIKRYADTVIVTGSKQGEEIGEVLIFEPGREDSNSFISAGKAKLQIDPDGNRALIEMTDVVEHRIPSGDQQKFSLSTAGGISYRLKLKEPVVGFSGSSPSEMSSRALHENVVKKRQALDIRVADAQRQESALRAELFSLYSAHAGVADASPDAATAKARAETAQKLQRTTVALSQSDTSRPKDRSLQIYELEYSKKFAIPAAGFFFSLLAFPLGLGTKRAGRTAGFGMALLLSTMYWGLLFAGQTLGLRSSLSPVLAIWAPNILVLLAGLATWQVRKRGARRTI